jgi:hypothetical protein
MRKCEEREHNREEYNCGEREVEIYIRGALSYKIVRMKRGSQGGKEEGCILGGQQE